MGAEEKKFQFSPFRPLILNHNFQDALIEQLSRQQRGVVVAVLYIHPLGSILRQKKNLIVVDLVNNPIRRIISDSSMINGRLHEPQTSVFFCMEIFSSRKRHL